MKHVNNGFTYVSMVPGGNILFKKKKIAFNMMDAIYTKCFFAQA